MDIIALGPQDARLLTLGAIERMKSADRVILRTGRHGAADYLKSIGVSFETLDRLYDEAEDFDQLSALMVRSLMEAEAQGGTVCYCVCDPAQDESVQALLRAGVKMRVSPGVSQADVASAAAVEAGMETENGLCSIAAVDAANLRPSPERSLLVTEINSRLSAGEVKLKLLEVYPAQKQAIFSGRTIALEDLDRQKDYDHLSYVYVPKSPLEERDRYVFGDLLDVMDRLRTPGEGCPWDLEQTHESLSQYLIEEAYEVLDTIRQDDPDRLSDELGDVLFQVVFHARVGWEYGEFDITDVTTHICGKMISRHPHIFADGRGMSARETLESWEQIKKKEKGLGNTAEVLRDVPRTLPALTRAGKIQYKTGEAKGEGAREAYLEKMKKAIQAFGGGEEDSARLLARLLFWCAGLARSMDLEPEMALDEYTQGFIRRFERFEALAAGAGRALESLTETEKEQYWRQAKAEESV